MRNLLSFHKKQCWQPGENTMFYIPLKSDSLDHSGNGVTTSGGGTITYQNPGALFGGEFSINYTANPSSFTLMAFMKTNSTSTVCYAIYQLTFSGGWKGFNIYLNENTADSVRIECLKPSTTVWQQRFGSIGTTNWHHYCFVVDNNTTGYLYVDGVLKGSHGISGFTQYPGAIAMGSSSTLYAGDIIYENKARTADEITKYYNLTKSNYQSSSGGGGGASGAAVK